MASDLAGQEGLGEKIMSEKYLNLLEDIRNTLDDIRDTLEDIKFLQEDLHGLLDNPGVTLEKLVEIRDTMEDIQGLQEGVEIPENVRSNPNDS